MKTLNSDLTVLAHISAHLSDEVTVQTSEIAFHFYLPAEPDPDEPTETEENTSQPSEEPSEEETAPPEDEPLPVFVKEIDPPKFAIALQTAYEIEIKEGNEEVVEDPVEVPLGFLIYEEPESLLQVLECIACSARDKQLISYDDSDN